MSKNLVNSSHIKTVINGDDISLDFEEEYYTKGEADKLLKDKVNVETGKTLSTNDFSNEYKTKLNGISTGAQVNKINIVKVNGTSLPIDSNKAVNIDISGKANTSDVYNKKQSDARYVQDASYKHTDNNYTTAEKNKLSGVETNAQKNIIEKVLVNGIEQTVKDKTIDIAVENTTVYGVRRKYKNNTSSAWERTDNAVGMVANATHDGNEVQNDFDNIYPWNSIYTYNYDTTTKQEVARIGDSNFKFDGTNGEVLTHFPEFYFKRYRDDTYEYIKISKYPINGFIKSPAFSVGRYTTYYDGSKAHSISGKIPETMRSITSFRTISRAVGTGFGQLDYHYFLLQMLFLVEYADYNSQKVLGNGQTGYRVNDTDKSLVAETSVNRIILSTSIANSFDVGQQVSIGTSSAWNWNIAKNRTITKKEAYNSGGIVGTAIYFDGTPVNIAVGNVLWTTAQKSGDCDILGMKSGSLNNAFRNAIIYRGVEDIFGNIYQFVDGINIKDYVAYVCYSPDDYKVDTFDGKYSSLGYTNASNTNTYAKAVGYDNNNPLIAFPTETGASDSTGLCDYYYSSSGNRIAFVGGSWGDALSAGLWFWNMSHTSSNASYHIGSRLLRYQE